MDRGMGLQGAHSCHLHAQTGGARRADEKIQIISPAVNKLDLIWRNSIASAIVTDQLLIPLLIVQQN